MIKVSRLNNIEFMINCELIEFIEETPDTVITLTTGKKYVVKESMDEILKRVIDYKSKISSFKIKD